MKKVILIEDNFPNNELYVHLDIDKETRICFEVASGSNNTVLRVNLNLQDAKTLRDIIQMLVIQMDNNKETALDRAIRQNEESISRQKGGSHER